MSTTTNLGINKAATTDTVNVATAITNAFDTLDGKWDSTTPSTQAVGDAASAGSDLHVARADHKHAMPSFAAPAASAVGDSQTAGTAATVARSDHKHARESFGTISGGAVSTSDGVSTNVARSDHVHGVVAGASVLLASSTLAAPAAAVDFTSISGSYRDLELSVYVRGDTVANNTNLQLRFNGDSGSNYDYQQGRWDNTSATASTSGASPGSAAVLGVIPAASATAATFGGYRIAVPNYAGTTGHKTYVASGSHKEAAAAGSIESHFSAGFWRNTAAITQVTLLPAAGNFDTGTVVCLYGRHS